MRNGLIEKVICMTEKRYQLRQEQLDYPIVNFCCDLVDTENNDKVICSFDNDIGTSKMVDLLNELSEENEELKELRDYFERKKYEYHNKWNLAHLDNINLRKENEQLKKYNKGQELEIVRLHNLADAMGAVLRELGIYDVYNDEQIENVKRRVK